jgi:pimeloyl-ACP methyl ester carboxylesterase
VTASAGSAGLGAGPVARFVLVHPAWFGGWCWKKVVPLLQRAGHEVHTPTLTGLGQRVHLAASGVDLRTHVQDVVNVLAFEDLDSVTLVGNSSAGMVITGVAGQVPDRIAEIVYLDAFVPADGQCLLDLLPPDRRSALEAFAQAEGNGCSVPRWSPAPWEQLIDGWEITDPVDRNWVLPRLRPTPLGHFTVAARIGESAGRSLPRTYLRCSRWPAPMFDRFAEQARTTPGWRARDMDASHVPFVTAPQVLAAALLDLVHAEDASG